MSEKTKDSGEHGKLLLEWSFDEYVQPQRGLAWYVVASLIFIGALIYAILTKNFLFILILFLLVFVVVVRSRRPPLKIDLRIFEDGVQVGSRFYEWSELKSFRIVYEPPAVKRLYFDLRPFLLPDFSVPLEDQNPLKVREILKQYLPEDLSREYETLFDRLNRWLKI
jgi:hypothetical protein